MQNELGFTDDEKILSALGNSSFLQMWTWPNLFRDQGKFSNSSDGKEICDLTVIFGNTIVLFSDKRITFNKSKDTKVAWCRWCKKAVGDSMKQIFGAERWFREYPNRVYIDKQCTKKLPIDLPNIEDLNFIRVIVTHGIEDQKFVKENEGSLSFNNDKSIDSNWDFHNSKPFQLRVKTNSNFVHIFTEETIKLVLSEFDTISDFIEYLIQRESLLTVNVKLFVSKESDIVQLYYENYDEKNKGRVILSAPEMIGDKVEIKKGSVSELYKNPSFLWKKQEDKVSYFWDQLIESFAFHALNGSSLYKSWQKVSEFEPALRAIAKPHRFGRRILAKSFYSFYSKVKPGFRGTRIFFSPDDDTIGYVFLLIPYSGKMSYDEYRELRKEIAARYAQIYAGLHQNFKSIVVIGAETTGNGNQITNSFFNKGQDFIFIDCSEWTKQDQLMSEQIKKEFIKLGLFGSRENFKTIQYEFPK